MSDTVESLIKSLGGDGWDSINISQGMMQQAFSQQRQGEDTELDRQAKIVARALETEDGRALLDLLVRITVLRPPGDEERAARTADSYAILAAERRGQNQLLFWLLSRLQRAHGKPSGGDQL